MLLSGDYKSHSQLDLRNDPGIQFTSIAGRLMQEPRSLKHSLDYCATPGIGRTAEAAAVMVGAVRPVEGSEAESRSIAEFIADQYVDPRHSNIRGTGGGPWHRELHDSSRRPRHWRCGDPLRGIPSKLVGQTSRCGAWNQ